jgi:RNA polymerase sigma factor (sigma-70 family)
MATPDDAESSGGQIGDAEPGPPFGEAEWGDLLRRYERHIRLVARVKLGSALRRYLDSVDLAQSVHLALVKGLREEKFDPSDPERVVGLAVRMVRRKVARHLRRLYRRERLTNLLAQSRAVAPDAESAVASEADPAAVAEFNEALDRILETLDEPDRRLIELRLEGCTTAEAAREMGVDADVLRVRLGRLRQRVRVRHALVDWL